MLRSLYLPIDLWGNELWQNGGGGEAGICSHLGEPEHCVCGGGNLPIP